MNSRRGCEAVQTRLEAVLAKRLGDPCVVDGSVGVDPVALGVYCQSEDFSQVRTLEQNLLTRDQPSQQVQFHLVQLEQFGVVPAIHRRIRQQQFRWAALDDRAQQIHRRKVVNGLRRQNHGGVVLPPGLQPFLHVRAQRWVLDEAPRLVQYAQLEGSRVARVLNTSNDPVQDVEQEWLQEPGVRPHRFEVEDLKPFDRERVIDVVEE